MKVEVLPVSFLLLLSVPAIAESTADDWYLNDYATLLRDSPSEKLDEVVKHYAETVFLHPDDGNMTPVNGREWLAGLLVEWTSAGWLSSEVAEFRSDQVNATTVTFTVKWNDRYEGGHEEFSCGWYVADFDGKSWLVTQYTGIDCSDHGL